MAVCSWSVQGATLAADRQSTNLPSSDNSWTVSAVKNQGICTGCGYAFAATAVMESCYRVNYGEASGSLR